LRTAPDETLIILLLKQFKGLLEEQGIELDTTKIRDIAQQATERSALSEEGEAVKTCLLNIVQESIDLLKTRYRAAFKDSMLMNANLIGGWKTPTEFQELISQKNNAEVRIAMGATLLAFFGDTRYIEHVFTTVEHEYVRGHTEAMLAMRGLSFAAKLDPATEDWMEQVQAKLLPSE
jgi:hypothetical protein